MSTNEQGQADEFARELMLLLRKHESSMMLCVDDLGADQIVFHIGPGSDVTLTTVGCDGFAFAYSVRVHRTI